MRCYKKITVGASDRDGPMNNNRGRYNRHSYHEDMGRYHDGGGYRKDHPGQSEGPRRRKADEDDTVLDNQDISSVTSQDQGMLYSN